LDQQGRCCWFVEYYGNKVGHLDPNTGVFQEWALPTAAANPYDIAVTSVSGSPLLWGTEFGADRIFAFSPDSGVFREYKLPFTGGGASYISVEPTTSAQVRVWFTQSTGNRNGEVIYDPTTSNVTLYEDSFPAAVGGGAFGVYAGVSSVWFAGFAALVRWDRTSQEYTIWPLPVHGSALGRFVTLDSSGDVWFTQGSSNSTSQDNFVGVLRGTTVIQEWQVPSLGADLRGITLDPSTHRPWVVEESPVVGNGAVAFLDNSTNSMVVTPSIATFPSGGTPVTLSAQPQSVTPSVQTVTPVTSQVNGTFAGSFLQYTIGPTQPQDTVVDSNGNVWVSETGSNKIARISGFGPDFSVNSFPSLITIPQGGSADITVTGTSIGEYSGTQSIMATGTASGVSVSSFNPQVLSIPSEGNVSLTGTLHVAQGAAVGTNLILLHAYNGTLDHTTSIIVQITNGTSTENPTSKCIIATATFGSALSPEVGLLRTFRDTDVTRTKLGASFMTAFNTWYYSFSPNIANYIADHDSARATTIVCLYPLMAFLSISSTLFAELSAFPDLAIYLSGLLACALIGAFYLGIPLGMINRRVHLVRKQYVGVQVLVAGIGSVGLWVGTLTSSVAVVAISSILTTLSVMSASAMLIATAISTPRTRTKTRRTPNQLMTIVVKLGEF